MRMPRLEDATIASHLALLPEWSLDGDTIRRTYTFGDFVAAMRFVNAVADEAERMNHHPDIDIRYSRVTLALTTHDSGGLTENDFGLASKADRALPFSPH